MIGSVRYFAWKREWPAAGTFLCGLDDADIKALAASLRLAVEDLQAIVDEQPDQAQKERLIPLLLGSEYFGRAPHDLVGRDAATLDPAVAARRSGRRAALRGSEVRDGRQDRRHPPARRPVAGLVGQALHRDARSRPGARADPRAGGRRRRPLRRRHARRVDLHQGRRRHAAARAARDGARARRGRVGRRVRPRGRRGRDGALRAPRRPHRRREVAANAYSAWAEGVGALVPVIGEATLAQTFFEGRTLAFEAAVDAARGEGAFKRWLEAMHAGGGRVPRVPSTAPPARAADAPGAGPPPWAVGSTTGSGSEPEAYMARLTARHQQHEGPVLEEASTPDKTAAVWTNT